MSVSGRLESVPGAPGRAEERSAPPETSGTPFAQRPVRSRALGGRRGYILRRLLAVGDLSALGLAYLAMLIIRTETERGPFLTVDLQEFLIVLPVWLFLASLFKLYHIGDRSLDHSIAGEVGAIFTVSTFWSWAYLLLRLATE